MHLSNVPSNWVGGALSETIYGCISKWILINIKIYIQAIFSFVLCILLLYSYNNGKQFDKKNKKNKTRTEKNGNFESMLQKCEEELAK